MSLSSDGTTALIGADGVNGYRGAAYIFHVPSEGSWSSSSSPTATLTDGSGARDFFGLSATLSADGTTALIGTPYQQGNVGAGAAYVFHTSSESSWSSSSTPTATLTNSSGVSHDWLGYSVALSSDGTTALAGAPGLNGGQGGAYLFHASAEGSWSSSPTPTATLTNSSGGSEDALGVAVALSADGTTALLGAPHGSNRKGAAYLFHASAEGSWSSSSTPTATLTNSSGESEDTLGVAVALSADGTSALVGAPGVSSGRGAAYLFHSASESSWSSSSSPTAALSNGSAHSGDNLGEAVAFSSDGTTALLGAPSVSGAARGSRHLQRLRGGLLELKILSERDTHQPLGFQRRRFRLFGGSVGRRDNRVDRYQRGLRLRPPARRLRLPRLLGGLLELELSANRDAQHR